MTITADAGPYVSFGTAANGGGDQNPDAGPSLFFAGGALLDPRAFYGYNPGQDFGQPVCGFSTATQIMTLNITPAALGAGAVAAAHTVASGVAMTLVSSSGAGILVGQSIFSPTSGTVTGLLAVGQKAARLSFGSSGSVQIWDPTTLTARALSITCNNSSGTGGTFTISGYDIYGYPMTETLTSAPGSALTVTGAKAWKYISKVVPNFTDSTYTYAVNTTDIFGFPLASNYFGDTLVIYPGSGSTNLITSVTGYTAAYIAAVQSSTTADPRGTYALQAASDGTKRLIVYQTVLPINLATANGVATVNSGLFGLTPA